MTTIAYKDGVMASDAALNSGDTCVGGVSKSARRDDGALCGGSGDTSRIRAILTWFLAGEDAKNKPDFGTDNDVQALIVRPDGAIEWHDNIGFTSVVAPFFAIGSGRDFALAAMYCGASAERAVECAAVFDKHTSGPVTVRKGLAEPIPQVDKGTPA